MWNVGSILTDHEWINSNRDLNTNFSPNPIEWLILDLMLRRDVSQNMVFKQAVNNEIVASLRRRKQTRRKSSIGR